MVAVNPGAGKTANATIPTLAILVRLPECGDSRNPRNRKPPTGRPPGGSFVFRIGGSRGGDQGLWSLWQALQFEADLSLVIEPSLLSPPATASIAAISSATLDS